MDYSIIIKLTDKVTKELERIKTNIKNIKDHPILIQAKINTDKLQENLKNVKMLPIKATLNTQHLTENLKEIKNKSIVVTAKLNDAQLKEKMLSVRDKTVNINAKLKDKVQLANRLKRRASRVKKDFDIVEDGLLVRGVIEGNLKNAHAYLIDEVGVPSDLVELEKDKKRVLTNVGVVMKLASELKEEGFSCYVVKEYPTWDGLVIEKEESNVLVLATVVAVTFFAVDILV